MLYEFRCKSCKRTEDRDIPVSEIVGFTYPCRECNGVMGKNYQRAKIYVKPGFCEMTQFDVLDPRAHADKSSPEYRAFLEETWNKPEPLFGNAPAAAEPDTLETFAGAG